MTKHRPKVLLLGNGLLYGSPNSISWNNFISKCSKQYGDALKVTEDTSIPYTIRASAAIENKDDVKRQNTYYELLNGEIYESIDNLRELLRLDFDAFITNNYTYELEFEIDDNFTKYSTKNIGKKYAISSGKYCNGPIINTFIRVEGKDIWHMHGEARLKSSIVLIHDEYGRLVQRILNYLKECKNRYQRDYNNLTFESWIDYLILGDVYILGLDYSFSEFDLWWLLSRRMREKAEVGKIIYYEPIKQNEKNKIKALEAMDVECKNMGIEIKEDNHEEEQYSSFYKNAIEDIKLCIAGGD